MGSACLYSSLKKTARHVMPHRMRYLRTCAMLLSACFVCSCANERTYKSIRENDPGKLAPNAPGVGGSLSDVGGIDLSLPGASGAGGMLDPRYIQASSSEEMLKIAAPEDLTFTDPDKPDAIIPEIEEAFSSAFERKKNWQQNYGNALRQARRSGMPILIWFHDSKNSPSSIALGKEVLSKSEFENWAKGNLVRLRYDRNDKLSASGRDYNTNEGNAARKMRQETYIRQAFEHFGVKGTPALVILSPDGQRITTIKGYKAGRADNTLREIKHDVLVASKQFDDLKARLSQKGYRTWFGTNGMQVFALLVRFDKKKGTLWLKEFDGTITKTNIKNLSPDDQLFINEQPESVKR